MGKEVEKSFKDSDLIALLSGGQFLRLTECRRSDKALFDWYASVVEEPKGCRFDMPLEVVVKQAREEFSINKASGFLTNTRLAPTNLVISHKLRESLNETCNLADVMGRTDAARLTLEQFKIEFVANSNCPQDAWFWPGMRVIACCKGRKLRNGRAYTVESLGEVETAAVTVRADDEEPIKLQRGQFFRCFRLPYAITYASAQGLTISGLIALHNTSHTYFNKRQLYVALSRATARNLVIVY